MTSKAEQTQPPERLVRWALVVVALLTSIAYFPALSGPELFDDAASISLNPSIRQLWPVSVPLSPPAATALSGRPITNLTFALNYWINGLLGLNRSPDAPPTTGYHLLNLTLHLAAGLLLFGIIRRTLRQTSMAARWRVHADSVALGITAIWLLHPIQVDAVAYLTQRTELLVSMFFLLTLYASIRAWDASTRSGRNGWFVIGAFACALGMGSKEVMFGAPLLIVLYDRVFRVSDWQQLLARELRSRLWFHAALFASIILLLLLLLDRPRGTSIGFGAGMPWYEYLHSQGWAIAHYLRLVIWPSGLSLDYGSRAIAYWRGVPGLMLLTVFAALTVMGLARISRWGKPAWLAALFFVILAPSSSVVPIVTEIAAERRMYLPLAAVLLLLMLLGDTLWRRWRGDQFPRRLALPLFVVLVAGLTTVTFRRAQLYANPTAVWQDAIAKVPDNPRARYNAGVSLAVTRPADAEGYFREAVTLDSAYGDAWLRLVAREIERHDYEAARRDLQHYPLTTGNDSVLATMATALFGMDDTTGALMALERAAQAPSSAEPMLRLAMLYRAVGRPADAVEVLRRAVKLVPKRVDVLLFLGDMLIATGKAEQAIGTLEEVVRLQPDAVIGVAMLSLAYAEAGRRAEAERATGIAVAHAGNDARAYLFAGRTMLTLRDRARAIEYLSRAVTLDPQDEAAADALATARKSG